MITLINVFICAPERQAQLVGLLRALTRDVVRHLPGFVSATVHRGLDGESVANYAQWESEAAWRAMVRHNRVRDRMGPIVAIATFQPRLYELASFHERA